VTEPGPDKESTVRAAYPAEVMRAMATGRFGRYVATRLLGAGGMGEVWKAYDLELRRWVALKLLRDNDPEELARFKREARTAGRLSHPGIAAAYDVGEHDGRHYIAMQFVDGRTLKTWPRTDRRALVEVLRDAARAVHYAHTLGVVHRDLKPDNIMVEEIDGRRVAVVLDFGLAKSVRSSHALTISGTMIGTPSYMPPEQARGEEADARSDVFGLGATLYDLLTDRAPFMGTSVLEVVHKVVEEDPPPIRGDIGVVVAKAMEKDPARRYPSAADLADDLDRWLRGEPIRARPASAVYRIQKGISRRRAVLSTLAAGLAAVVGLLVWLALLVAREAQERARLERFREAYAAAMRRVEEVQAAFVARSGRKRELGRDAMAALDAALRVDERQAAAWVALGRVRKLLGEDPAACWARALAADPNDAEAFFERGRQTLERYHQLRRDPAVIVTRGRTTYRERDPETEEERALREAGDADLGRARAAGLAGHLGGYLEAVSAFGRGEYGAAESALDRYLDRVPWEARAFLLRARARQYQGKAAEADEDFREAVSLDPDDPDAYNLRGEFRSSQKRYAEAEADYARAIALDPSSAFAFNNLGRLCHERRDWDKAIAHYTKAIELRPRYASPLNNRGNLYYDLKRWADSEADYAKALEIDPGYALTYNNRARLYSAQKRYDDAVRDYSKAIALFPRYARAYYNRARVHHQTGRLDDAEADYSRAIEIDPGYATAWCNRGNLRHDRRQHDPAEADYSKAIELDPDYALAYSNRGNLYYDLKRWEESDRDYSAAVRLDPDNPRTRSNRGLLYKQMERWDDAERDFTRAIELDPKYALARRHRGSLHYDLKRWALAVEDWEKACELDPQLEPRLRPKITEARQRAAKPWPGLGSDIFRVERAGPRGVRRALHDRPPVREHRELHLVHGEPEEIRVARDAPRLRQAPLEVGEIERRPLRRRHLHGVAPAQARRRLRRAAVQELEAPIPARRAVGRARHRERLLGVRPHVDRDEPRREGLAPPGQDLDRLRRLERRHHADRRAQDARRVARRRAPRRGQVRHHAPEAGALPGDHREHHPVAPHAAAVHPRLPELHARVVEEEPRLEVVGAVEHKVGVGDEPFDVPRVHVGHARLDGDVAVDLRELRRGGRGLRQVRAHVLLVEEHLALEVVELDEVAVADPQAADAGAGEVLGEVRAERAAADESGLRRGEARLAVVAERGEEALAGVAVSHGAPFWRRGRTRRRGGRGGGSRRRRATRSGRRGRSRRGPSGRRTTCARGRSRRRRSRSSRRGSRREGARRGPPSPGEAPRRARAARGRRRRRGARRGSPRPPVPRPGARERRRGGGTPRR
jgi:tetratricopeptide (TPR) repeat protein/predicted Ser/Thr protein kinase